MKALRTLYKPVYSQCSKTERRYDAHSVVLTYLHEYLSNHPRQIAKNLDKNYILCESIILLFIMVAGKCGKSSRRRLPRRESPIRLNSSDNLHESYTTNTNTQTVSRDEFAQTTPPTRESTLPRYTSHPHTHTHKQTTAHSDTQVNRRRRRQTRFTRFT